MVFTITVIGCWVYLGCGWQHVIEKPLSVRIRDSMSMLVEVWLIYNADTTNSDRQNNSTSVQLDCYNAKNQSGLLFPCQIIVKGLFLNSNFGGRTFKTAFLNFKF